MQTGTGKFQEVFDFEDFSETVKNSTNRLKCANTEKQAVYGEKCGIILHREKNGGRTDGTTYQGSDHERF